MPPTLHWAVQDTHYPDKSFPEAHWQHLSRMAVGAKCVVPVFFLRVTGTHEPEPTCPA
jgi:hypothetical protein